MDGQKRECKLCDRVWAGFGILLGGVFLYVSIDLALGGRLTSLIAGSREVTEHDAAE